MQISEKKENAQGLDCCPKQQGQALRRQVHTERARYVSRGENEGHRGEAQRPTLQSCLRLPTLLLRCTNLKREHFTSVFINLQNVSECQRLEGALETIIWTKE